MKKLKYILFRVIIISLSFMSTSCKPSFETIIREETIEKLTKENYMEIIQITQKNLLED